jgi:hypothetical protein
MCKDRNYLITKTTLRSKEQRLEAMKKTAAIKKGRKPPELNNS